MWSLVYAEEGKKGPCGYLLMALGEKKNVYVCGVEKKNLVANWGAG